VELQQIGLRHPVLKQVRTVLRRGSPTRFLAEGLWALMYEVRARAAGW